MSRHARSGVLRDALRVLVEGRTYRRVMDVLGLAARLRTDSRAAVLPREKEISVRLGVARHARSGVPRDARRVLVEGRREIRVTDFLGLTVRGRRGSRAAVLPMEKAISVRLGLSRYAKSGVPSDALRVLIEGYTERHVGDFLGLPARSRRGSHAAA